jgi:exodeoxyribonuclease VII large subunit
MTDALDPLTSVAQARPLTFASAPVLPVSLLVSSARLLLERQLGLCWVSGEISGCTRAASGHLYFTLKDASAQARCVFFRHKAQGLDFALRDGLAVEVRATATIYEARGDFQLNVDSVRLSGPGALYERFVRLKATLESLGWFAAERKRAPPAFPRAIGIVTSTRAAALSDVLTTLARRWPAIRVVVYPAAVQGEGAATEIAAALRAANSRTEVDVLIVCRGGGSLQDLWAFNEEAVARAVFESALPVISGVGHETDFTICDFVADVRAPTPTGAAALAVPDRIALAHRLEELARRACRAGEHALAARMQRVDLASRRLVHPAQRIAAQRARAAALTARLGRAGRYALAAERQAIAGLAGRLLRELRAPPPQATRLASALSGWRRRGRDRLSALSTRIAALAQNLAHLSPQAVLERGYAIVTTDAGSIVQDAAELAPGDAVTLTLARGRASAIVADRDA